MAEKKEVVDIAPTQDEAKDASSGAGFGSYKRIFTYCDRLGWALNGTALIALSGSGAMLPIMDLVFGKFVNTFNAFATGDLSPADFRSQINKYTLWFVYLFIAKFAGVYIWTLALSISGLRTTKALRIHFLERTLRQDIPFFDQPDNGSISTQISTNGNLVSIGIGEKLGLFFQGIATFVAAFAVAFAVQWKLTLITLSIVPAIVIVVSICVGLATKVEGEVLTLYSQAGTLAEEAFASIANVHAFWAQPKVAAIYETYLAEAKSRSRKLSPIFGILFSTEFFCVYAGYGLSFWQGVHMYARGEIDQPGDVVTVLFAVILAATAMTQIAPQIMSVSKAAGAAHTLFTIMDREPAIDAMDTKGDRPESCQGDIKLRAVNFAYPQRPDIQIFNSFNLDIPAGKTTALVGPSGSGKSTIVGLLERWYLPQGGQISFDGRPLDELNLQWLRSNVRLVQQEPTIFNASIEENVKLGLLGTAAAQLSQEKQRQLIEDACRAAYAHEFIEHLPEGYQTQVGQRGTRLSGGQKQRLAIARAIVSNPRVLLLDEATSALDPKAERIVQEALDNVAHGRTTLVIAHKLSTVRKADNIAVITKGRVIEQGTHEELIAADGAYARLVRTQDLEQGKGDIDRTQDDNPARDTLVRAVTSHSVGQAVDDDPEKKAIQTMNYSLLRCLWIMGKEQPELYVCFLITLVFCITAGVTFPALALIFSRMINVFTYPIPRMLERGDFFALMFFVIALNNLISYFVIGWIANIISQTLTYKYRLELFVNLIKQDRTFFDQPENTTGALGSNLTTKPTSLQELLSFNIMLILIGLINLVSSSILGIATGWKLGLVITFGALPPIVLCGFLRIRLEFKLDDDVDRRFADSTAIASEAVAAIRTVASLTLERHIQERYTSALATIERTTLRAMIWTMFWYALCSSISFLGMALGFWYGGRLLSTGEYTTTQFFTVFVAIIFAGESTAQFFSYTTSITKGQGGANYMLWLRAQKPTMREHDTKSDDGSDSDEKSTEKEASVRCEDLEFAYPLRPSAPVIRNITVGVPSGQSIALVGPSGCGKSTMISLLERFYDPTSGQVLYNDTDVKTMNPRGYRRNLALVEQEPTLYRMSIRENIALGLEGEATDDQVNEACRAANIYDFVSSLPNGLATLCGPNGTQLSGGQKQRVAIARALIRNPKVLLLDEATSALDSESEQIVQGALREASSQRTTITVAHRLSTIKDADRIFVFLKGRVEESGTHKELLDRKGMYYDMCLGQSLERSV